MPRANIGNEIELRIYHLGDLLSVGLGVVATTGTVLILQIADKAKRSQRSLDPNIILLHAVVSDIRSITVADLKDGLHPNDAGYQKMADIWLKGIQEASNKGWIQAPNSPEPKLGSSASGSNDRNCLQPPYWVEAIKTKSIATGIGHNGDLKFHSNWVKVDSPATDIGKDGNGVVFADLNGDNYLYVNKTSGSVITYLNVGFGDEMSWIPVNGGKDIASGVAPRELIRFVDIDLDGKDDYVVMGRLTASATVYLNRGPKQGAPGNWVWDGPHEVAPGALGAKGADIMFADINNDGKFTFLIFVGSVLTSLRFWQDALTTWLWTRPGQLTPFSTLENRTRSAAFIGMAQVKLPKDLDPVTSRSKT
ncbi:MAG: hypothetical protein Q9204_006817 [Flavoplaca sp. TL-2023a]